MVARAGVDQHRAANQDDSAVTRADVTQALRDLADQERFGLLTRDVAAHEGEDLRLGTRTLEWRDAHPFVADDELLALLDVR